jgi:phage tail protein X
MDYYDRYKKFRVDETVKFPLPFFKIKESENDIYLIFDRRSMRMDTLSYKYYGDPNYAWLILNANPELPPYEYLIEDGTSIRIPYPLSTAIDRYEKSVAKYLSTTENSN